MPQNRPAPPPPASPAPADVPLLDVRTRRIDVREPLLRLLPAGERDRQAWVRAGDGHVGWGRVAALRTEGRGRFADAEAWWRRVAEAARVDDAVQAHGSGLMAYGSFAFSPSSAAGGSLTVPEVVVGRCGGTGFVTTMVDGASARCAREVEIAHERLAAQVTGIAAPTGRAEDGGPGEAAGRDGLSGGADPAAPGEVAFADGALPGPVWEAAVATAIGRIAAGELDKVVLARDLIAEAAEPLDARWLLRRLAAEYSKTWVFAVDGLVGATPEMLCRLERGLVTSRVLAGTIRRTGDDERDLALAASLARSSKDLEEHEYAVRSVADALAGHCTSMNVPEAPFVLHLPNVMHLATDVTGRLTNGTTSISLAAALHPSAAVCGTPREVAAAVVDQLEGMDRGRYAGPVGWVDAAGDGEWGIALRCGALDEGDARRLRLFAGCGIVAGSDPAAELAESDAKLVPMRSALAAGPLA